MEKRVLNDVITDQGAIAPLDHVIPRHITNKVLDLSTSRQIVIIKGVRRSGKSIVLEKIRQQMSEQDYVINFDDDRLVNFQLDDFQALYELFVERFGEQSSFYFDEIQNIPQWERFIRRLHNQGNKIYITGSNAEMLSAELGTRLTGRFVEIELYPYSFLEFLAYKGQDQLNKKRFTTQEKGALKALFNDFMIQGGLPEYLDTTHREYLHSLYESILYRDIIVRHHIKNHQAIKEMVFYLASNVGKEFTYNSLKKTLGLSSQTTVSDYCGYLEDCYLCFFINRFDYSLKKQLLYAKKVYFIDQALAVAVGFRFSHDQGRLLENIVFLELKRRGYEIYFHKDKKECDFVIKQGRSIVASIQVTVDMTDEKTREREVSGLVDAMQAYQLKSGLIITMDELSSDVRTIEGKEYHIEVIPIWSWLLTSQIHADKA